MFMCWCIQEGMHMVYIYFQLLGLESKNNGGGVEDSILKLLLAHFFSIWHSLIIFSKESISYNNWLCFSSYRINLQKSSCSHLISKKEVLLAIMLSSDFTFWTSV
jgi:hypothetical protein